MPTSQFPIFFFRIFPLRCSRLFGPLPPSRVGTGLSDRCVQLLDLLGISDLYEFVSNALTPRLRLLTPREVNLLRTVYGESVPYARIRVDERARVGTRRYGICYVSFHTVNAWGAMSDPLLVHEVMHVWQYVHLGALYIPRALAAQRTAAGYDYGGPEGLRGGRDLYDFNLEQAAALVEDAFRAANGYPLRYGAGDRSLHLADYDRYLRQVRQTELPKAYRQSAPPRTQ
ncbi:hypothetical protein [Lewinella sp. IMCC34183]|uniref:hypothetical protein n=1 Tax=Lewinella sp. IMCC34183 TaxID=2248762 RepID=UPI000E223C85|nr:hypothetical protein [Lewinella sp. IMCC34183]